MRILQDGLRLLISPSRLFQPANAGGVDGFVTELNPAGNGPVFSTYVGGEKDDYLYSIAVDSTTAHHNIDVAGMTYTKFDPKTNPKVYFAGSDGPPGSYDALVGQLSNAGVLNYLAVLFGTLNDRAQGVATDQVGNVYVTGTTISGIQNNGFPTSPGAFQTTMTKVTGGTAAFVTAGLLGNAPANLKIVYSTYFGGDKDTWATGIAVDPTNDNAYIVGYTNTSAAAGFGTAGNMVSPIQLSANQLRRTPSWPGSTPTATR